VRFSSSEKTKSAHFDKATENKAMAISEFKIEAPRLSANLGSYPKAMDHHPSISGGLALSDKIEEASREEEEAGGEKSMT